MIIILSIFQSPVSCGRLYNPTPVSRALTTKNTTCWYHEYDLNIKLIGVIMESISANCSVSISELKKNPSAIIEQSGGEPIAILNHNRPTAYLIPAETYEALLEKIVGGADLFLTLLTIKCTRRTGDLTVNKLILGVCRGLSFITGASLTGGVNVFA
jgi:prevent-host-death family protein